ALRHPPFGIDGLPVHVGIGRLLQGRRRHPQLVLLVRAEIHDGREPPAVVRPEHVGLEQGAVAHGHVDVLVDEHAVWPAGEGGFHFHEARVRLREGSQLSGSSTFTSSASFFQYANSVSFQDLASSMELLGTALIICFLNAVCTGSDLSASTTALCSVSSTSRGVA